MRKISEYQNLGFSSLADYLLSDHMKSSDFFVTDTLQCTNGQFTLPLSKSKSALEEYYLLLVAYGDEETRRLLIPGQREERMVSFDLSSHVQELSCEHKWVCYVAMGDSEKYLLSRLKKNSEIVGMLPAPEAPAEGAASPLPANAAPAPQTKTSGGFGLLKGLFGKGKEKREPVDHPAPAEEKSKPVASPQPPQPSAAHPPFALWEDSKLLLDSGVTTPDGAQRLLLRSHPVTQRVNLIWMPEQEAQVRLSGRLLHRSRSAQELASYPFTFSIVMAVYNVEDYLEEAIDSVIEQDIGFEEHVQLILVDDGSPDGSGAICDRYKEQYPNNIIVIHKENGGVASARNAGKAVATGKYVNFMDSDDKFSLNVLSCVKAFFDRHYSELDVVTIPLYFFEGRSGPHWQNYKFDNGPRVINLWEEWNVSDMNTNSSFIRLSCVQDVDFDPVLVSAEDSKFMMSILLNKMQLGVVTECCYWYRRRGAGGSLINTATTKPSWYNDYFDHWVFALLDMGAERYGHTPQFVQNTVMMDLQWRFLMNSIPEGVLTDAEQKTYLTNLQRAVQRIDDEVIRRQRKLTLEHKMQIFHLKDPQDIEFHYSADDVKFLFRHSFCYSGSTNQTNYEFITIRDNCLHVEGVCSLSSLLKGNQMHYYMSVAGDYFPCGEVKRNLETQNCVGELSCKFAFRCSIPINPRYFGRAIYLVVVIDGHPIIIRRYAYKKFTPFYGRVEGQYYYKDGYVLRGYTGCLKLECKAEECSAYEKEFLASLETLILPDEVLQSRPTLPNDFTREKYEQVVRLRSFALSYEKKRPVWLIGDRPHRAGDNGAALFRFLMQQEHLPADVYFVLQHDSPDYPELSALGPVLDYGSEEHLKMQLIADFFISSQGDEFILLPYAGEERDYSVRKYYADLLSNQKNIFLQHGVTKDDISSWLNRYNKNYYGFVTTNARETQSILDYNFYYTPDKVWFTGFPRFDLLYEDSKNQVVVCPSWRNNLHDLTFSQFVDTDYYRFYISLLSDPRLHAALKEKGYRLALRLHPSMMQFIDCFQKLEGVELLDPYLTYRQIFAQSNLLLTDYSSVFMDFAYLHKPVIYTQFDRDTFYQVHIYQHGYFDYDTDGFGPVTKTVDETVDAIIDLLNRDCQMAPEYLKRVNDFFPVNDYHNCERVYHKLLELMENN